MNSDLQRLYDWLKKHWRQDNPKRLKYLASWPGGVVTPWPCLLCLLLAGCGIGFDVPANPKQPVAPDTPTPIERVAKFDAAEFAAALADEAALASEMSSELGSAIVSGTLRQYGRIWASKEFDSFEERLLKAVPAIELSGAKARDLTPVEVAAIREVR